MFEEITSNERNDEKNNKSNEISDQQLVENEIKSKDNFKEVINNNKIIIENIKSLRNESNNESKERPEQHISYEIPNQEITTDITSNESNTEHNNKTDDSETDVDFNGNDDQMSDSSEEIYEENK